MMSETAAAYWEPVIRMYGASVKTGLILTTLAFPNGSMARIGDLLEQLENGRACFDLVQMQHGQQISRFFLVGNRSPELTECVSDISNSTEPGITVSVSAPVDLIYFHGPHFHDRYGIVDAALRALSSREIDPLAVACTGSSIYLVVAERQSAAAVEALEEIFFVPGRS